MLSKNTTIHQNGLDIALRLAMFVCAQVPIVLDGLGAITAGWLNLAIERWRGMFWHALCGDWKVSAGQAPIVSEVLAPHR